jgi:hypothetical protein
MPSLIRTSSPATYVYGKFKCARSVEVHYAEMKELDLFVKWRAEHKGSVAVITTRPLLDLSAGVSGVN